MMQDCEGCGGKWNPGVADACPVCSVRASSKTEPETQLLETPVYEIDPGWYPDPNGLPADRYWNGEEWESKTRPQRSATGSTPDAADTQEGSASAKSKSAGLQRNTPMGAGYKKNAGTPTRSSRTTVLTFSIVALLVIVAGGFAIANWPKGTDTTLTANSIRDTIESRGIPCDQARVYEERDFFSYTCAVAGSAFRIATYEMGTSNALLGYFDAACSRPFTALVGSNWRAETRTPLVTLGILQDAFGGMTVTSRELCPIVDRVYYRDSDSQWEAVFEQLKRASN